MKSPSLHRALAACVLACIGMQGVAASAATSADPQKVLRYIFPAAET
ncbi:MAG: hypothetical protein H7315_05310, partial [Herminiimonas sp.]|nr:hypothetical protein [Herminiimonas sp.]